MVAGSRMIIEWWGDDYSLFFWQSAQPLLWRFLKFLSVPLAVRPGGLIECQVIRANTGIRLPGIRHNINRFTRITHHVSHRNGFPTIRLTIFALRYHNLKTTLITLADSVERVMGIEPTSLAWEAKVIPLYDTRVPEWFYLMCPCWSLGCWIKITNEFHRVRFWYNHFKRTFDYLSLGYGMYSEAH